MSNRYKCKSLPIVNQGADEVERILNEYADSGYHYINNIPIDISASGKLYEVALIFERDKE